MHSGSFNKKRRCSPVNGEQRFFRGKAGFSVYAPAKRGRLKTASASRFPHGYLRMISAAINRNSATVLVIFSLSFVLSEFTLGAGRDTKGSDCPPVPLGEAAFQKPRTAAYTNEKRESSAKCARRELPARAPRKFRFSGESPVLPLYRNYNTAERKSQSEPPS